MNPIVFIQKLAQNSESLEKQFCDSFSTISIVENFDKANAIFVKPNLTFPRPKNAVTTRKEFVESLVAALRKINSKTKIYIGEGEGGYNSFSMSDAMHTMGFFEIEKNYPNTKVVNLSKIPSISVELGARGKPYFIDLPKLFFDEIDFSISCPVPKVHCMTKITLSLKNQWGCLPDTMRLKNHYVFDEIVGQVCNKLKFHYAFLDGKFGLNNNGPMVGDPIELNWFVASNSLGAFDMIVSEMMGFDWRKIAHLKKAREYGYISERNNIEVIGDIVSLKRNFVLKRDLWNYPASAAFKSKKLTHLFYFSIFSKPLHYMMYMFRKRPIS